MNNQYKFKNEDDFKKTDDFKIKMSLKEDDH